MNVTILEVQDKICMLKMWFLQFCLFITFLKTLYTCRFLLKSVSLNEFAKKGDTFESCNMEVDQLKYVFHYVLCDF